MSSDLSEIAQTGISQIVDDHRNSQQETDRHIRRLFWIFGIACVAWMAVNIWMQRRIEERINEPGAAVVQLSLSNYVQNTVVCPGDVLAYSLTLHIGSAAVVDSDSVVRNLDTDRTEILSDTVRNIYETPGDIVVANRWTLPEMLPATTLRPERMWSAGHYRRNVAVTGAEGDKVASVVSLDFVIGDNCPGVLR